MTGQLSTKAPTQACIEGNKGPIDWPSSAVPFFHQPKFVQQRRAGKQQRVPGSCACGHKLSLQYFLTFGLIDGAGLFGSPAQWRPGQPAAAALQRPAPPAAPAAGRCGPGAPPPAPVAPPQPRRALRGAPPRVPACSQRDQGPPAAGAAAVPALGPDPAHQRRRGYRGRRGSPRAPRQGRRTAPRLRRREPAQRAARRLARRRAAPTAHPPPATARPPGDAAVRRPPGARGARMGASLTGRAHSAGLHMWPGVSRSACACSQPLACTKQSAHERWRPGRTPLRAPPPSAAPAASSALM